MQAITMSEHQSPTTSGRPLGNNGLTQLGVAILYFYFAGAMLATPYFQWQYAKRHGFASWVMFGEIAAMWDSLLWPVHFVVSQCSAPAIEVDRHYVNSCQANFEALRLVDEAGGLTELSSDQKAVILERLEIAIREADLTSDSYLATLHPDMPIRFRKNYTESLRQLVQGMKSGNNLTQGFAAASFNNFSAWASQNLSNKN